MEVISPRKRRSDDRLSIEISIPPHFFHQMFYKSISVLEYLFDLHHAPNVVLTLTNHKNQKLGVFGRKSRGGGGGSHSCRIIIHNLGIIK